MCLVFKRLKSIKKNNLIENKSIGVVNKRSRQMLCYGRRVVEHQPSPSSLSPWTTYHLFSLAHSLSFFQAFAYVRIISLSRSLLYTVSPSLKRCLYFKKLKCAQALNN